MSVNNEMESKFDELKQSLIQKMEQQGADNTRCLKRGDFEFMCVASNEDNGTALVLHSNGSWSKKIDTIAYDIGSTETDSVIREYAEVVDMGFQLLEDEHSEAEEAFSDSFVCPAIIASVHRVNVLMHAKPQSEAEIVGSREMLSDDEYDMKEDSLNEHFETTKEQYISDNRDRLIGGILHLMEELVKDA